MYGLCLGESTIAELIRRARQNLFPSLWAEYEQCGRLKRCASYGETMAVLRMLNEMRRYCHDYDGGYFSIFWAVIQGKPKGCQTIPMFRL